MVLIFFFLTAVVSASDCPSWIPHRNYQPIPELEKAFKIGQAYYLANVAKPEKPIDYEYNAYVFEGHYVIVITPLHRVDGGYAVVTDGDQCVYITQSLLVKGVRQCMAPVADLMTK
ncbi:hypothetical protein GCM10025776_02560 [Corallincola platygyrae]